MFGCRGSVVVLTLWGVIFLAFLAMTIASLVGAHLKAVSDMKWTARSRSVGMRALADAADGLAGDTTPSYDTLHESWASGDLFKNTAYAGGTYSILKGGRGSTEGKKDYGLADEGGKVSLNRAQASMISFILRQGGMTSAQADDMALFIVDWRDSNTVREGSLNAEACAGMPVPSRCKNADFEVLEELWWMPGITAPVYEAVRDELTLYGGTLNVNTATALALQSVGVSANGAERILAWREASGNFFDTPSSILARAPETGLSEEDRVKLGAAVAQGFVGTHSDYYRGEVEVAFGGKSRRVASFIISRDGEVKWWKE